MLKARSHSLLCVISFAICFPALAAAGGARRADDVNSSRAASRSSSHEVRLKRIDQHNAALLRGFSQLGPRVEIRVSNDAVYRIDYSDLRKIGVPVDNLDPRTFALSNQGEEVAILVNGEKDGRFDPGDSMLFYGERFRGDRLASIFAEAMTGTGPVDNWLWQCRGECRLAGLFERYGDQNVYWLRFGRGRGLRMRTVDVRPGQAPVVSSWRETVRLEESRAWWSHCFEGEDVWFWDEIRGDLWEPDSDKSRPIIRAYPFQLTRIAPDDQTAQIKVEMASRAAAAGAPDHHVRFSLNGRPLGELTWDGRTRQRFSADFPREILAEGENSLQIEVLSELEPGKRVAVRSPWLYLEWIELSVSRTMQAENDAARFRLQRAGTSQVEVGGFTSPSLLLFDIAQPLRPRRLVGSRISQTNAGTGVTLRVPADEPFEFLGLGADSARSPSEIAFYTPPTFPKSGDYVVISPKIFHATLAPLLEHRRKSGLKVVLVDADDLYKEFSYGIRHPIAIKSFLAFAFENWEKPPTFVLLVGSGHWNLKGFPTYPSPEIHMPPNLALVDPWQGEVDSANLLATLTGNDAMPDIYIGRVPASTTSELKTFVDKVLEYESGQLGAWRYNLAFVADNVPDFGGDFVKTSDSVLEECAHIRPDLKSYRVYENDFGCKAQGDEGCRRVTDRLIDLLNNEGALVLSYTGHASIQYWAHEHVLTVEDLSRLHNRGRWPLLLSMTCLDGYWIHPAQRSLVVQMLLSESGIIAAFSPTGLGLSAGHEYLHAGFLRSLLSRPGTEIGKLAWLAKEDLNTSGMRPDLLHTYTLFGDPALRLACPPGATNDRGSPVHPGELGTVYSFTLFSQKGHPAQKVKE